MKEDEDRQTSQLRSQNLCKHSTTQHEEPEKLSLALGPACLPEMKQSLLE